MRRFAAILLLALLLTPLAAAATPKKAVFGLRALGNPKLGYFVYSLKPGAARQGGVIISNVGTATGTVKLFSSDATTGRTTGTVYLTDRNGTRVGSWVSLSTKSLTLKPGQHETVPFTVRVPANAVPGQWVGGIVAETSRQVTGPKSKQKASVQIKIRDLTIVAVQVNVPGPAINRFTIGGVKTGGQRGFQELVTHIANDGNVLVKPTGSVTVLDRRGKTVQTLTFKMDTFLPQTSVDYPLLLKKALAPGDYSAKIRLAIPGVSGTAHQVVTAQPRFSISKQDVKQVFTSAAPQTPPPGVAAASSSSNTPWALIAGAAAAILVLLGLVLLWLRRTKPKHKGTTLQPLPPPAAAGALPAAGSVAERTQPPAPATAAPTQMAPPPAPEPEAAPEPVAAPQPVALPATAPVAVAQPAPGRQGGRPECDQHLWEVAYDRGSLGNDGVWRFPHRCRSCGLELLATDVTDATAQADASF
jgi:hypothetical protein